MGKADSRNERMSTYAGFAHNKVTMQRPAGRYLRKVHHIILVFPGMRKGEEQVTMAGIEASSHPTRQQLVNITSGSYEED
jgi:hypothetical protein